MAWDTAVERGDPTLALVAGLGAGLAGLFGWIKGDELAAVTLFILSVVSFSLARERKGRVESGQRLEEIDTAVKATRAAVEDLQAGTTYRVLLHENVWEMKDAAGSVVHVHRRKRLRFNQNEVITLLDFTEGDGERVSEYSPGKVVHELYSGTRKYSLIALDRIYSRDEEIDFNLTRTSRDAFLEKQEEVTIEGEDMIDRLRMKIVWHPDRLPSSVCLIVTKASGQRHPAEPCEIVQQDGEAFTVVDLRDPERGGKTTIEWTWP